MADEAKVPAVRGDHIGDLARRLCGDDDHPPDLTAAIPLFDALMGEGDVVGAMQLRYVVFNMMSETESDDKQDKMRRARRLQSIRLQVYQVVFSYLYDFNSACLQMASEVEELARVEEVKKGKVELETVRQFVPEHVRPGQQVLIDESRRGVVVSARDAQGFADVMPVDEEYGYAEDAAPMMRRQLGHALRLPSPRFPTRG